MGATIHSFQRTQSFPDRIEGCLQASDWDGLTAEIEAGFDPKITAYGGLSLVECILSRADQDTYVPPLALPRTLLEVLLKKGVGELLPCGKPLVVACVEYGQWGWSNLLIDAGFVVESEEFPVLDSMALGRSQRCQDAVMAQCKNRLASVEGDTEQERAAQRSARFSMAMMEYAKVIYAKDARSISRLVHRLVNECGVDLEAGIKQDKVSDAPEMPGIRSDPTALDLAILRQDEAMAFALLAAGASSSGAVSINRPDGKPVVCRPVDMALSARCFDLFVHILQENPASKLPVPGAKNPGDPAAFPLSSIMVSSLSAMENGAGVLEDMLNHTIEHWDGLELASAMHVAAKRGQVGMMKVLHTHGVEYDVPLSGGLLPIHQACFGGHQDAIDFLISKGSSLADEASCGVRALDMLEASSPELAAKYSAPAKNNVVVLRPRPR